MNPNNLENPAVDLARNESIEAQEISIEELNTLAEQNGGKIVENNGKTMLVEFESSVNTEDFNKEFLKLLKDRKSCIPVIVYSKKFGHSGDRENQNMESINECIEVFLSTYKKMLIAYEQWVKDIEAKGIIEMNYAEAYIDHGVEDRFKTESEAIFFTPRFFRFHSDFEGGHLLTNSAEERSVKNSSIAFLGLDNKIFSKMMEINNEWAHISPLFRIILSKNQVSDKDKLLEMLLQKIREIPDEIILIDVENISAQELRSKLENDAKHYLSFLRIYHRQAVEFINTIESYK